MHIGISCKSHILFSMLTSMKQQSMTILSILFLVTIVATSNGSQLGMSHQIHLLRPRSGARGSHVHGLSCLSWRLGVETHNIIGWKTVPRACEGYIGHYMLGHQYRKDSKAVVNEASLYAQSLKLAGDGKDMWIFDIDDTALSNLPYYAHHGFGVEPYNPKFFNEWVMAGQAPPLPESLKLYKKLSSHGIKIGFITGRSEDQRAATSANLKNAGYHKWEKLILKGSSLRNTTSFVYKSSERKKLENDGYRIVGNIGDQWSDILGTNPGNRTFK